MMQSLKRVSWVAQLFFIAVLTLLISLGFWQLDRAKQKRFFLERQQQLKAAGELILNASSPDDLAILKYRSVSVKGHYDGEHQFLIDNQHANGKVGYFVLTPFRIDGINKAVLVNRGWIPLSPNRLVLPPLPVSATTLKLTGRINSFPSVGIKLAGAEIPSASWPSVVQVVDSVVLAKKLGVDLFSFQVELDPDMPEGYLRAWHPDTIMPPEKHIAYAVQWFGLALTFSALFFWFNSKKTG